MWPPDSPAEALAALGPLGLAQLQALDAGGAAGVGALTEVLAAHCRHAGETGRWPLRVDGQRCLHARHAGHPWRRNAVIASTCAALHCHPAHACPLLRSSLQRLRLPGCTSLSDSSLEAVLAAAPQLRELDVSGESAGCLCFDAAAACHPGVFHVLTAAGRLAYSTAHTVGGH